MRVMAIVKGDQPPMDGPLPPEMTEMFRSMGQFNERLAEAGIMVDAAGLEPSNSGKRIAYEDGDTRVIDGPFAESKELVAGVWILSVESMDEAIEWMKQAPFGGGFQLELRPIGDLDAFDEAFDDDMRAVRDRTQANLKRNVQREYANV
jgi:hypothetical protein